MPLILKPGITCKAADERASHGRCPRLSADSGRSAGSGTDIWRTGRRFYTAVRTCSQLSGYSDGLRKRSVKPSAQPTLVRTQHLPHKIPGQARCRCIRRPGLMRVRERFGRPFPLSVGQLWARSGLVSGLRRSGPEAGRLGDELVRQTLWAGVLAGHGRVSGPGLVCRVQRCPTASSCDTDA